MQKANVFISYAKNDYKIVKSIIDNCFNFTSFQMDKIKYRVKFEWDDHIVVGEEIWEDIKAKIISADVIVCMLSQNFFKSDYILNKELPLAIYRRKDAGISILGVLIEECDFQTIELKKYEIIPKKNGRLKPILKWNPRKECWEFVKNGLRVCIKNSIERLPDPLKYRQDLSPQDKTTYKKQFLNPHIQRLEKKYKNKKLKKTKSKKSYFAKQSRNIIFIISLLLLMLLIKVIFLS